MRNVFLLFACLTLLACGGNKAQVAERSEAPRLGVADVSDSVTTAYGLAQPGLTEANPALAWAGPAAPLVSLGVKYAAKSALVENGMPADEANFHVERGSAMAACANIVTIAGAAAPPAMLAGALCGVAFTDAFAPRPAPPRRVVVVPYSRLDPATVTMLQQSE